MTEDQPKNVIPKQVGRLDPVIDAIRDENWALARSLCLDEMLRQDDKMYNMEVELSEARFDRYMVWKFIKEISDPESRETILAEACR